MSHVSWTRFVRCNKCGSMFMMEEEDLMVAFSAEEERTKRFVQCQECYEYIKLEVETDEI